MRINKKVHFSTYLFTALILISSTIWSAPAQTWRFDRAHSSINFSVKHWFTPVEGRFDDFNVELDFDPEDLENSSLNVAIQISSINTGNDRRDNHLQTADFFNVEKFPTATFMSSTFVSIGDNKFVAKGTLTIKDVAREIELPFKLLGIKELPKQMQKMFGGVTEVASFEANYVLQRLDYGVGTGSWVSTVMVSDEVNIAIKVEANHK